MIWMQLFFSPQICIFFKSCLELKKELSLMLPCLLPHRSHSCFLVRMKSSSSGHTLVLPNTCTLTLITRDKRNAQWDSMKRSSAGCFFESFLSPMVCFCVSLDTVQHRSRMFSRSRQFVFSEIRTWPVALWQMESHQPERSVELSPLLMSGFVHCLYPHWGARIFSY